MTQAYFEIPTYIQATSGDSSARLALQEEANSISVLPPADRATSPWPLKDGRQATRSTDPSRLLPQIELGEFCSVRIEGNKTVLVNAQERGISAAGTNEVNERANEQATAGGKSGDEVVHSPKNENLPHDSFAIRPFLSPDCKLSHSVMPDGTACVEQVAVDGSRRTQTRRADGTSEDKISDRYGRPVRTHEALADGSWTLAEMQYHDSGDKVSPFVACKRVTRSDGSTSEIHYAWHGGVIKEKNLGSGQDSLVQQAG